MNRDHMMGYTAPVPVPWDTDGGWPQPMASSEAERDEVRRLQEASAFERGNHLPGNEAVSARGKRSVYDEATAIAVGVLEPPKVKVVTRKRDGSLVPVPKVSKAMRLVDDPYSTLMYPFPLDGRVAEIDRKRIEYNTHLCKMATRLGVKGGDLVPAVLANEIRVCTRKLAEFERHFHAQYQQYAPAESRLQAALNQVGEALLRSGFGEPVPD